MQFNIDDNQPASLCLVCVCWGGGGGPIHLNHHCIICLEKFQPLSGIKASGNQFEGCFKGYREGAMCSNCHDNSKNFEFDEDN